MKLTYCGPEIAPMGGVPLPEGWPAADHDEPDEALAKEKVASGNYKAAESHDEPGEALASNYTAADPPQADASWAPIIKPVSATEEGSK